jgi:hypothetical protein
MVYHITCGNHGSLKKIWSWFQEKLTSDFEDWENIGIFRDY